MKNFLSRMSNNKWLFIIAIYVDNYSLMVMGAYSDEVKKIRYKSLEHFGGDISGNLGLLEVLKSAGFNYWGVAYELFYKIFIPYLLIAAYFDDYKNEAHDGWRRVYFTAQTLVPSLIILFFMFFQARWDYFTRAEGIVFFGWVEIVVLMLVKFTMWKRKGIAQQAVKKSA